MYTSSIIERQLSKSQVSSVKQQVAVDRMEITTLDILKFICCNMTSQFCIRYATFSGMNSRKSYIFGAVTVLASRLSRFAIVVLVGKVLLR